MNNTTSGLYAFITNLPIFLFCVTAEGWLFPGAAYGLIVFTLAGAIYEAQGEGAKKWEKKGTGFWIDIAAMVAFTFLFIVNVFS